MLAGVKSLSGLAIGDTLTEAERPAAEPVPGYREAKPVVFSSIYPMATDDYEDLTKALEKLKLNDASLIYEKDSSAALGFGFRCGFLGLLHLDVVQERLEREYDLSLILSAPSVRYRIVMNDDKRGLGRQPDLLPGPGLDQGGLRAVHQGDDHDARALPRDRDGAVPRAARGRDHLQLPRRGPNGSREPAAPGRGPLRLLRPAEVDHPGLRVVRLRAPGLPPRRHGQGGHPRQRREGRRPLAARPPRVRAPAGAALLRAARQDDPPPAVQDRHPGRHRRPDHRPHHHQPLPQGRDGEVLRGRHLPQEEAPREAEGRQEEDEDGGRGGDPAGGLRVGAPDRGRGGRR